MIVFFGVCAKCKYSILLLPEAAAEMKNKAGIAFSEKPF